jgi:hypothetical protein
VIVRDGLSILRTASLSPDPGDGSELPPGQVFRFVLRKLKKISGEYEFQMGSCRSVFFSYDELRDAGFRVSIEN